MRLPWTTWSTWAVAACLTAIAEPGVCAWTENLRRRGGIFVSRLRRPARARARDGSGRRRGRAALVRRQLERRTLGDLVAGEAELDAVDPLQVGELEERLHRDLARAHAEVVERRRALRVQMARVERLVDAARQQLAVEQRAVRLGRRALVLLGDADVAQSFVARLLRPAAVAVM